MIKSESIKKMFPDWETIEPGNWSENGITLKYGDQTLGKRKKELYIGLYREPDCNTEYLGTYTLEIIDGDDVIFCETVE